MHNAAHTLFPKPAAAQPLNPYRTPWDFDAALPAQGSAAYTPSLPFMEALTRWRTAIAEQRLFDETVDTLHTLSVDPRDGALCRGKGGAGYTPHAWSQLTGLMRAQHAPAGLGNVTRWLSPLSRHHAWADIVRTSLRPRAEEGVMRMMWVPFRSGLSIPVMRAVVSGRHSLTHFDDLAVLLTVGNLEEKPERARIARGWDETHASFDLAAGSDVGLSFYMRNSETGCASLSFSPALRIAVLDATVVMPNGEKFERVVRLAAEQSLTARRRHTLPRKANAGRISEAQRAAIARERIGEDITSALAGSRVLADAWERAKSAVRSDLVPLAKAAEVTDSGVLVLADAMMEIGVMVDVKTREDIRRFARDVATVMAEDSRLKSLPHGSMAHLAASLAVLAVTPNKDGSARPWDYVVNLQRLSGKVLMGA